MRLLNFSVGYTSDNESGSVTSLPQRLNYSPMALLYALAPDLASKYRITKDATDPSHWQCTGGHSAIYSHKDLDAPRRAVVPFAIGPCGMHVRIARFFCMALLDAPACFDTLALGSRSGAVVIYRGAAHAQHQLQAALTGQASALNCEAEHPGNR